jgi:long-chain acyl-CoA synthetase
MREYGTPAAVEITPTANLADVVFDRADREPQAVIFRRRVPGSGPAWQDVTAVHFRDEVTALAKGLMAAGIGAGDRVALLSRTRYEWTVADYAIWSAGAVTVPIYETSSAEQVEWILGDSGARALIAETPGQLQAIADAAGRLPGVQRVWLIDKGSWDPAGGPRGCPGAPAAGGAPGARAPGGAPGREDPRGAGRAPVRLRSR